ncbi:MAG TPA: F0F1 ATP synthase subunit gamma [Wenzhouxiangella sp.]|nr:F0F1 ATP synthase subunit gamma [Wenzhouxiangella sp.]
MEALDHLQRQLVGLEDMRDIVRTMKALSVASVRQYEHAAAALADYYRTVELGLHAALRGEGTELLAELARPAQTSRAGLIVFGSDHGLCGRFNEDVVEHVEQHIADRSHAVSDCRIVAVGVRAAASLERHGFEVERELLLPGSAGHITNTVQELLLDIDQWRGPGEVSSVTLVYNHSLQQRASYRPAVVELLPIDLNRFERLEAAPWPTQNLPGFSLPRPVLLSALMQQYFFVILSRACADSQAAEHNSRMVAMQAAERNLDEQLDETSMRYRRARQEVITAELLDVVSGFEVITGSSS